MFSVEKGKRERGGKHWLHFQKHRLVFLSFSFSFSTLMESQHLFTHLLFLSRVFRLSGMSVTVNENLCTLQFTQVDVIPTPMLLFSLSE